MIVRLRYAGMGHVVVDAHVIDPAAGVLEVTPVLLRIEILKRDHVDRADKACSMVVGKEGILGEEVFGSTYSVPMPEMKSGSFISSLTFL